MAAVVVVQATSGDVKGDVKGDDVKGNVKSAALLHQDNRVSVSRERSVDWKHGWPVYRLAYHRSHFRYGERILEVFTDVESLGLKTAGTKELRQKLRAHHTVPDRFTFVTRDGIEIQSGTPMAQILLYATVDQPITIAPYEPNCLLALAHWAWFCWSQGGGWCCSREDVDVSSASTAANELRQRVKFVAVNRDQYRAEYVQVRWRLKGSDKWAEKWEQRAMCKGKHICTFISCLVAWYAVGASKIQLWQGDTRLEHNFILDRHSDFEITLLDH